MKTYIYFLIFFFLLSANFYAQAQEDVDEKDVPEVVVTKLGNLFPGAESVAWQMEDKEYYANFTYEGSTSFCAFTYTGRWLVSKTDSKFEDVPRSMQRSLSSDFGQCVIEKISLRETKDVSEYIVSLNDTIEKAKLLAFFDISGNFVKKTDGAGNDLDISLTNNGGDNSNDNDKMQPVHPKELPSSINSYVIVNYPEHKINEAFFLNNDEYSNTYYLILGEDLSAKTIELWFDFQGKLIKSTGLVVENPDNNNPDDKTNRNNVRNKEVKPPYPENKVPANAVEIFKKKEARAEEIRWDTVGTEFMVSYYNPSRDWDCRMYFNKSGVWTKTVVMNDVRDLHPLIQRNLEENYGDLDIYTAEYFTFADKSKYYLVKVYNKDWLNDPMVYTELYYSRSGRLEKEVLANYIDPDDEYYKEKRQNEIENLQNVIDGDDISLDDGDMVDGQNISQKELPSAANQYIKENYSEYRFLEAMTLSDDGQYMYSVFIKREGYDERKRVLFDLQGKFIKEEDI
ncbi:MAG: PepSY-like domain-containing protein [Bacteroidales bacterium]|nr:PepSY-like domain-containing protein [Bacteroidales bacterium]